MPTSTQYVVSWSQVQGCYLLQAVDQSQGRVPLEDGEGWLQWLEEQRAFAFAGRSGRLNLLKEQRKRGGAGYWYAYQRQKGGMVKRYVGRSSQVQVARLEEIAALLMHQKDEAQQRRPSGLQRKQALEDQLPAASAIVAQPLELEPLLMAKLHPPRLQKDLLPREHLLTLLDKGLDHKLLLLSAPAGYGKTTLVGQWLTHHSTQPDFPRVAFLTLDEGDNDPLRFWRYVIAACQSVQPDFGKDLLELLLAHRLPPFKSLELFLTALLNELSRLPYPGMLILDDFHVMRSTQIASDLSFVLEHLPTAFHLVLLIRGEPLFSLARLRAHNEILDIYPPHLSFSLEEMRAFCEQELPYALSPKILRQLYERLDGWPAGLRLLVRELNWSADPQRIERMLATFVGSYWSVQDYFLHEVLRTLPPEQQEFLLQTSILPRLNAGLCDAVLERTDSARLLDIVRESDLFIIPLDRLGEWGRYHYLFAGAMQQEAHKRLGSELVRLLTSRASIWYEEHGFFTEAIETAFTAAEHARAATLLEAFIARTQLHTSAVPELYSLHGWFERLPKEELERHPELCLHAAMLLLFVLTEGTYTPDEREPIHHLLRMAELRWRDVNNTVKLAEIFAFRALLARQDGRILQAVTWARQALAWLPQDARMWRNLALTVVGVGEGLDGAVDKARAYLLEALALSEAQGNAIYARATRGMLAWLSYERGELRYAAAQFQQMQTEARAHEDRDDIARTQLFLAQILYQWNRLDEAEQAVQEVETLGEQWNQQEFSVHTLIRLAYIEQARQQPEWAQQRLTAGLAQMQAPLTPQSYQLICELQLALARLQLANGNIEAVRRWSSGSKEREERLPLLQRRREQLLAIRLLVVQEDYALALERLQSLLQGMQETGHTFLAWECQIMQVRTYAQQGAEEQACELLRDLLERTRSEGCIRLYLDEGEILLPLLRRLLLRLRDKALLAYAQQILSAYTQVDNNPSQKAEPRSKSLVEPLSAQEQKVLRLLAAGNANAEIARQLVVSVNTVRTQVQSIYRKLNVNNRVEASKVARELEL